MPKLFLRVVVPETVPAVTPSTPAPTDTEPTLTSPAVVENEPADTATGNAPAEASGPDTVNQAGNVETEDAPVGCACLAWIDARCIETVVGHSRAIGEYSRHWKIDTAEEEIIRLAGS